MLRMKEAHYRYAILPDNSLIDLFSGTVSINRGTGLQVIVWAQSVLINALGVKTLPATCEGSPR